MFFKWLERQRKRPESERWVIAVSAAAVLTGLIVVAWLPARFAITEINTAPPTRLDGRATSEFKETFTEFQNQFSTLRDSLERSIVPEAQVATSTQYNESGDVKNIETTPPRFESIVGSSTPTTTGDR